MQVSEFYLVEIVVYIGTWCSRFIHCMKWHYCVDRLQYTLLNLEFSR